jgi:hypothetical protein
MEGPKDRPDAGAIDFHEIEKSVKRCPVQLSVSRRTLATVPTTSMLVKRLWMPVAGPFWSFQS